MFANIRGFICIGSSSGIKGVVVAPSSRLQGIILLLPTGIAKSYLLILGEHNVRESACLVSGQSGLLPFTVCSHVVFESWPMELVALHEVP